MSHQIELDGLNEWLKTVSVEFASSFGAKSNKVLRAFLDGSFVVYNKGKVHLSTTSKGKAVKAYNELP